MGRKRRAFGAAGEEGVTFSGEGDPLLTALFMHDTEGASRLIAGGECDLEVFDHLGWRPLHRAAYGGHTDIVEMLIERKANTAAADSDGVQPLHVAVSNAHVDCCRMLLAAGADPKAADSNGLTPELYAAIITAEKADELRQLFGVTPELLDGFAQDSEGDEDDGSAAGSAEGAGKVCESHDVAKCDARDERATAGTDPSPKAS
eukprot:TRINITY_DN54765_c0_g1_i1.p1 TRINITY_DN54765_c0_g1~~TRINITY_DN54765_c0_g1_i1.p1  ORF type:complete len:204 (+),score=41.63 TRINITY_DN54765_c0_g1_i1:94-705(+)